MNLISITLELNYQNKAYKNLILRHFEILKKFIKLSDLLQLQV
jgi:hypothetical protein